MIKYGTNEKNIDVTHICLSKLNFNDVIIIQHGDSNRSYYFSDPSSGIFKKVFIYIDDICYEYEHFYTIKIDLKNSYSITTINHNEIEQKISDIHNQLQFESGSLKEELAEQKM